MRLKELRRSYRLFLGAVAAGALAGTYWGTLRNRVRFWGATSDESTASLPGDSLLEAPGGVTTRAIRIDAPRSAVWPWIAQIGPSPRAGAYTYDWIENSLGLDMHSADEILPEFQSPAVGDSVSLGPNVMHTVLVREGEALCWLSEDGNWLWSFVLREEGRGTRLISRNSFRLPTLGLRVGMAPMEIGSLVMERKMLKGIKARAERLFEDTAR